MEEFLHTESAPRLRISVWRGYVPQRIIVRHGTSEAQSRLMRLDSDLQQEVYSWTLREDPFGGIEDEHVRGRLTTKLMEDLNPTLSPSRRRCSVLEAFLVDAEQELSNASSEWVGSQDFPPDDDSAQYIFNPLLAFCLHLRWILDTFSGQADVSVSVQ